MNVFGHFERSNHVKTVSTSPNHLFLFERCPHCRAVQLTDRTRLTDRSCQLPKPTDLLYNRLRLIRSNN